MHPPLNAIFKGKTVFITGHTGFKGSWLSIWLRELGAHVVGYSLAPPTRPSHFELAGLQDKVVSINGDIKDLPHLKHSLQQYNPDIVIHLAAQALVIHSYENPHESFEVNVMGTVNILEAARECPSVKGIVCVTTDKCYENNEWLWGYRENDRLGGSDPYSASKAMAELAIHAYRSSYPSAPLIASVRAGNVIGGGDFSAYRLLPDIAKALMQEQTIKIRNPRSIRPWLHVLDCLYAYLLVAAKLLNRERDAAQAWNFGPKETTGISVENIVEKSIEAWGKGSWMTEDMAEPAKEMGCLRLNWDKASHLLPWSPQYTWQQAIQNTLEWFKAYASAQQANTSADIYAFSVGQIKEYSLGITNGIISRKTL